MSGMLILGAGNPLAGDDGIGVHVAEALTGDERLPPGTEVRAAGTDLLRHADAMRGRRILVVIDALLGDEPLGTLQVFDGDLSDLDARQGHAHHLSVPQALELLRSVTPALDGVAVIVAGVTIPEVRSAPGLSAALAARVPLIADDVVALVRDLARTNPG
ncbi:MAG: hydrogenase maturation protease [Gemmatimonadales bacterium]|nr:hydrogenase maturation protease [Gemmatimonadales bacterium]